MCEYFVVRESLCDTFTYECRIYVCSIMDILEETGLSDWPLSLAWATQCENHPRSDKSGLSLDWRREAFRGYPPFLGNGYDREPLKWDREDQASCRGFPESLGRQFGGLPSPVGVLSGQVSWGRFYRGSCAESSPEEESTGVVAQKTLPG